MVEGVRIRSPYLALLLVAPMAILVAARRLGPRTRMSLVVTSSVTLGAALLASYWFWPDPSDLSAAIYLFLFVLPCVTAVAGPIAAVLNGHRARWPQATAAAVFGCFVGTVVVYAVPACAGWFFGRLLTIAPCAIYAACAAIVAAAVDDSE